MGIIRTICISEKKGTAKTPVEGSVRLIEGFGIEGDAHAGRWHRQISLLSYESIRDFKARGAQVRDGSFGENLITEGIDLSKLPVGTLVRAGESLLRVTQIGKECHSLCAIGRAMGSCIMPSEGVFVEVLEGGLIKAGDVLAADVIDGESTPGKTETGLSDAHI